MALGLLRRTRFVEALLEDFGYQVLVTSALLALSPLVVAALDSSAWLLPLFAPPLAAVYWSAKAAREREFRSMHDDLTHLPNRKHLLELVSEAIDEAARDEGQVALLLLDLDRFKEINDTLGHDLGDRLLQLVGARLESTMRPQDTVARLGGDEFAVLLTDVDDLETAEEIAGRTRAALNKPFVLDGLSLEL